MADFTAAFKTEAEPSPHESQVIESNPLSLDAVRAKLDTYNEQFQEMLAAAEAHEVTDDETNKKAVEMAGQLSKFQKKVSRERLDATKPARDFTSSVNGLIKPFEDRSAAAIRNLKQKISTHAARIEMERREKERKQREAAEAMQKRIDAEAKRKNIEPVKVEAPPPPEAPRMTRTEAGSSYQKKSWTWDREEVDFSKVPDEYKTLDTVAINRAVKNGTRNIPGIRIFEKIDTVIRT